MHRLILLGGIHLESPTGSPSRRSVQARPLALLSVLARSSRIPLTREKVARLLWPDVRMHRARRRLSDLVYILRQELGTEAVRSVADRLELDPSRVDSDAAAFERALDEAGPEAAVARYTGPFLDGFILRGNRSFDEWVQGERRALAGRYREALEELAVDAEAREDWLGAVRRWRELAADTPSDSRVVMRLMTALARSGNVPGAVEEARAHEVVLRAELDLPLPVEVRELAGRLVRKRG
jgi:DNA-binding SARP family transcriptional activator